MRKVYFLILAVALFMVALESEADMTLNFKNRDILSVIETYAKTSGKKFIVDPGVKGKISIFTPDPVGDNEAYEYLSSALAVNGYAISKQGDVHHVIPARNVQRSFIEVTSEKPAIKPERMVVWVYDLKHASAANINRELRILPSKEGEIAVNGSGNQLVFTDWSSNLNRIAGILERIDKPTKKR